MLTRTEGFSVSKGRRWRVTAWKKAEEAVSDTDTGWKKLGRSRNDASLKGSEGTEQSLDPSCVPEHGLKLQLVSVCRVRQMPCLPWCGGVFLAQALPHIFSGAWDVSLTTEGEH